jgi:hypothetical protein
MLNVAAVHAGPSAYHALRAPELIPAPARRPALGGQAIGARLVADYLEGWAVADPVMIAAATAPGYRFDDPFVGTFSTVALPRYFGTLRSRAGLVSLVSRDHLSFVLRGPMDTPSRDGELQFWREVPCLGLTGMSLVTIGPLGVTSERVTCDLNIASEQLRGATCVCGSSPASLAGE